MARNAKRKGAGRSKPSRSGRGAASRRQQFLTRTARVFDLSETAAEQLMSQGRRQSLRFNPLAGAPRASFEAALAPWADGLTPIEWCDGAWHMDLPPGGVLPEDMFVSGQAFIQNASSFIPVLALDPQPGERILDLCAAPGGKTSHIAALTGNSAEIWANDALPARLPKLHEVLDLLHVQTVEITGHPGQFIDRFLEGPFDRILIDAQCTGEGMIDLRRPASLRYWSMERIAEYGRLQRKMLSAAAKLLKPGGVMVYSTCTIAPEENEAPVHTLLSRNADMTLEPVDIAAPGLIPARTRWEGEAFDPRLSHARRVLPSAFLEAFFVARFRKAG
ncbi:RsmB/NOP family class I SAM-dependent RNA methyltransferase [Alkalicaulis satelles]|uniref:RsmB/NOP family class I SAM-dependent RNA methyltransferase n=1 Tax=Alkalicaulis satelles TaxID=2609175 RepID=A0A5M6ZGL3_9PROT|nr:RsmB/NOP family class I SAM-dependent RNA methyltransferase [Alkalicaulis satelles]KAA5803902.1 RsmB/NOP family class I SAM-dependent RNA methyltransferase [Alkalicaulis satelles]